MREVKNSGTWITDVDGANKISFNRCALNAIPMCRDNAWDIGTTLKLKAVIQQNGTCIKYTGYGLFKINNLQFPMFVWDTSVIL